MTGVRVRLNPGHWTLVHIRLSECFPTSAARAGRTGREAGLHAGLRLFDVELPDRDDHLLDRAIERPSHNTTAIAHRKSNKYFPTLHEAFTVLRSIKSQQNGEEEAESSQCRGAPRSAMVLLL